MVLINNFSTYYAINPLSIQNIFSERRYMLANWSEGIESYLIASQLKTDMFVGFQQLQYFGPVFKRYQQIAKYARVWVFGEPNAEYPPVEGITYIHLNAEDELTHEWFVIIDHPQNGRMLVARETTENGTPHPERMFRGVLTNDAQMIARVAAGLRESFNLR